MILKANLHMHTADDPKDSISYTFFEAADRAAELGFRVLAVTCHNRFVDRADQREYAARRGILAIPGIEATIEGAHVVVLNPDGDIERVRTFEALRRYREEHPGIFVLAPHPFFPDRYVLGRRLDRHIDLFDAIEHSWFYSRRIDFNRRAERAARARGLPYLATSDTHDIRFLDASYALVDAEEPTVPAVFRALREGRFENKSAPRKLWRELVPFFVRQNARNRRKKRLSRRSSA